MFGFGTAPLSFSVDIYETNPVPIVSYVLDTNDVVVTPNLPACPDVKLEIKRIDMNGNDYTLSGPIFTDASNEFFIDTDNDTGRAGTW